MFAGSDIEGVEKMEKNISNIISRYGLNFDKGKEVIIDSKSKELKWLGVHFKLTKNSVEIRSSQTWKCWKVLEVRRRY